jgi:hypothetical protein
MKIGKKIICLEVVLFSLLLSFQLTAANTLKLSTQTVSANETFTVRVDINNEDVFAAFQLDMPVPSGFTYISNSALFDNSRIDGQSLDAELLTGNILRIIGYSPSNTEFVGDSGTIVRFQLKSSTIPGTFPLNLVNPVIGNVSGLNILTDAVNGSVLLQAPDISINENIIDFNRTPLGQSTTRSFTIYNNGNLPLNITNISFNSTYFEVVGNSIFTINGGQNYSLSIQFNAEIRGAYNKIITITSNDPDKPTWNINLSARAFAVNELHTGAMFAYSGKQASLTYTINNMDPFTGFQFDLQLPSPLTYVYGSAVLSNRKSNHVVSANVISGNVLRVIAYSANGEFFTGHDGSVVTLNFSVNGTGGNYSLPITNAVIGDVLSQNCISDSHNGNLNVAAPYIYSGNSIAFGDVSVLDFKQLPHTIYNWGSDTLKISSVQFDHAAFSLLSALPIHLLPGQSTELQLKFLQTTEGTYTGTMKLINNDPARPICQVNLSGTAFSPNSLFIPDLRCKNIDTLWVPVKVNNIEPFLGFQFDFEFPSIMEYIPGSVQLTGRSPNYIVNVEDINSTKIRVLAYSLMQSAIVADTGAIVRLGFVVNSNNESISTANLGLSASILGDAQMHDIIYQTSGGLLTLRYPHALSGNIVYNNASNTPLDSVWVSLKQNGIKLDSVMVNINGDFSFPNVYDGIYVLNGRTTKPWGGVNGTDALKIQRHFAGLELITVPIRLSGADVNNASGINGTDAIKIKRRFAGLDAEFTKPDWLFEKTTGNDTVVMGTSNTILNYYGLCTGDVNGSYSAETGAKSVESVEVYSGNSINVSANQQIFLPIELNQDCDIGAISMVLDFPLELVSIEEVTFAADQPYFSVIDGKLLIVWSETNGLKIRKNEPFAFIKLKTTSSFDENKVVRFLNASPLTEIADNTGNIIKGVKIEIPSLTYLGTKQESDIKIYPNPAVGFAYLFFTAKEAGTSSIRIFDALGRCVKVVGPIDAVEGLNKVDLDFSQLKRNLYTLTFELHSENQNITEVKSIVAGKQ